MKQMQGDLPQSEWAIGRNFSKEEGLLRHEILLQSLITTLNTTRAARPWGICAAHLRRELVYALQTPPPTLSADPAFA